MKRSIFFDANPLLNNKSGVGHFTERLVSTLSSAYPDELELNGHYFNFLNQHKFSLLNMPNVSFSHTSLIPQRAVNLLRRAGIFLPLWLFYRKPVDIAIFPNYVVMPTGKKIFSAVVIHDLCFVDHPEYVSTRNCDFLQKVVPRSVKQVDLVVAVSEFTKKRIQDVYKIPADKIYVMYNPPTEHAVPNHDIITRYGLKDYLLFVSTLEPRKNVGTLLSAYSKLSTKIQKEYPLVLVGGKGWKDEAIVSQMGQLQAKGHNIIWTGYVTDAERGALYKNSTLCVLPSHYEGFGMPILEAMSYGKPVVCSDIEVFHEVGTDAPAFFNKDRPNELAELLTKLLGDQKELEELAAKSKAHFAAYPTWQQIATDFYSYVSRQL